MSTVGAKNVAG